MGQLQNIKKRAIRLSRLAHSIDPFDIASYLDITIIYEKLIGIHGYYTKRINTKQIHINEDLPSALQTFTCAHELGHAVLHPNSSTPFLRQNTLFSIDRLEREANKFAVELLIPDQALSEYQDLTIDQFANMYGYDRKLIELRLEK
jgi:Zn-dependent peptidase ImmA (M78 family)